MWTDGRGPVVADLLADDVLLADLKLAGQVGVVHLGCALRDVIPRCDPDLCQARPASGPIGIIAGANLAGDGAAVLAGGGIAVPRFLHNVHH